MNVIKKISLILIIIPLANGSILAQQGGDQAFEFLNVQSNTRIASLGGYYQIWDDDLNMGLNNPSLLHSSHHNKLALNYLNYVAGINNGLIGYCRSYEKKGTFSIGMQYINYGKFTQADETSQITGSFTGGEYAFQAGWGYQFDSVFSIGVQLKPIMSFLDNYSSFGLCSDFGATYIDPGKRTVISLLARNAGVQLKPYIEGNRQDLPLDVQLGITHKLKYVPFRVNFVLTQLNRFQLSYRDTTANDLIEGINDGQTKEKKLWGDNIMRHVNLGGEFVLSRNFHIRLGYNYQRRQELKTLTRTGLSGFSVGAGIKISKFSLGYCHSFLHLAGGQDLLSISLDLNEFTRRNADKRN